MAFPKQSKEEERRLEYAPREDGKTYAAPYIATRRARALAQAFLSSRRYRVSLEKRILAGRAQQLEVMLWAYAYGKPREQDSSSQVAVVINMPGVDGQPQALPTVLTLPGRAKVDEPAEALPNP